MPRIISDEQLKAIVCEYRIAAFLATHRYPKKVKVLEEQLREAAETVFERLRELPEAEEGDRPGPGRGRGARAAGGERPGGAGGAAGRR